MKIQTVLSITINHSVHNVSDNHNGAKRLSAEALIVRSMQRGNEERLHETLGDMAPTTWHCRKPNEIGASE
jgi:hypothetical protein